MDVVSNLMKEWTLNWNFIPIRDFHLDHVPVVSSWEKLQEC